MPEYVMTAPMFITLQQSGTTPSGEVSLRFGGADAKSYQVNLHRDVLGMVLIAIQQEASKLPNEGSPLPLTQFLEAEAFEVGTAPQEDPLLILRLKGGIQLKLALDPTGLAKIGERISALARKS